MGACPSANAQEATVPSFSAAAVGAPPASWHFATLPGKAPTQFEIVELDDVRVLKVESNESYGNLIHVLRITPTHRAFLAWRWRLDQILAEADIRTRTGDDSAAKICLFFDFDAGRLSLGERTRLSIARSRTGEHLPAETLCYVWDNKQPVGTGLVNAFTSRIRFIVLQSGTARLGKWVDERRDVVADYKRMFGDESPDQVPDIIGVAIQADSDNTHGHGLSYVGDITLLP